MNKNKPVIWAMYVFSFLAMISSQNWFFLWLSLEMNTFSFVSMMAHEKMVKKDFIITFFIIQVLSSLMLLFALITSENKMSLSILLNVTFLLAILLKMGVVPLHNWGISAMSCMSMSIFFLFLTLQKIFPFFLLKIFSWHMLFIIVWIFFISIAWGASQNFNFNQMKFILMFSGLSHMGWLLMAILNINTWEVYFIYYTLMLMFMMSMIQSHMQKMNTQKKSFSFILLLLTLGGLPPMMGFYPKLNIFFNMMEYMLVLTLMLVIIFSLSDLFIYARLSFNKVLNKKNSKDWWKKMSWAQNMFFFINSALLFTVMM